MDYKEIEHLLQKYWQANSSLQEEEKLRNYFCYGVVAEHLKQYKPLFQQIAESKSFADNAMLNEDFDQHIIAKIKNNENIGWWQKLNQPLKIAASIIIVFTVGWIVFWQRPDAVVNDKNHVTINDPQQAYKETKKALLMISVNLNRGKLHASESLSKMDSAQNIIKENKNLK
jgi:hypothetical protein